VLACLSLVAATGRPLGAQAVTGGAVQGTVVSDAGTPVPEATVRIINVATGERWETLTRASGRFALEHISVGGPYRVEVHALGFAPDAGTQVSVAQAERVWLAFELTATPVHLDEITVRVPSEPELDRGRTGPALTLTGATIARVPLAVRDFSRLAVLSPFVTPSADGRLSFGGQHPSFNSVVVDGTTYGSLRGGGQDGFGGIPGNQNEFGFFDLVPEAVAEAQVMTAPFDVRYGDFTGGLISAVTRSGTNRWHGSLYGYLDSPSLAGTNPEGTRLDPFTRQEYGGTIAGPIIRDRVAIFLQGGANRNRYPQTTPTPDASAPDALDSAIGIRYSSAERFRRIMRDTYGVDAGSFEGIDRRVPIGRVYAKVTAQLGVNSRLEASQTYLHERPHLADEHGRGFLALTSGGATDPVTVANTRLDWTTAFGGRWTNQVTLGYRRNQHRCVPDARFVRVEVTADEGVLDAGQQRGCDGGDNLEAAWELTDNLELAAGAHHLTVGTHNELIRITDVATTEPGQWFFSNLDSLAQRLPFAYQRFPQGPDAPADSTVRFGVNQLGVYGQDQWTPNARLTLTAGLRIDVPFLTETPQENPALRNALGVRSGETPSGNVLWSPRLGVNYDVSGGGKAFVRGGVGLFAGRPAYAWLENASADVGRVGFTFLECAREQVPALTLDPASQPTTCAGVEPPRPSFTVYDPAFRFPRDLKVSLGADVALPWGLVGTTDLLFTAGVNQFAERDLNLGPPVGIAAGEGGRPLYGSIVDSTGESVPNHRGADFDAVTQITNGSGNRAFTAALQLRKHFAHGSEVLVSYAYTRARNRTDAPGLSGRGNLGLSVLDGTWEEPLLGTSLYSRPHKLTVLAIATLPLGLSVGLTYLGISGWPLTYTVDGDANADGFDNVGAGRFNDPVYVPTGADDITLAPGEEYGVLEQYIQQDPCLRGQRGRLLRRNSCRDPWFSRIDAQVAERLPGLGGHAVELVADLFNLPNMIDRDWGQVRHTVETGAPAAALGSRVGLLQLVGYDDTRGRGIYRILAPGYRVIDTDATRWRVRLSLRYGF
jgi:hypothetical protein